VILRNSAQESPKLELQMQRYGENNFGDLFVISRKWLGVYLEIVSDFWGFVWELVDCGLI
jgi:hypothetical protein